MIGYGCPLPRIDGEGIMRHQGGLLLVLCGVVSALWHSLAHGRVHGLLVAYSR